MKCLNLNRFLLFQLGRRVRALIALETVATLVSLLTCTLVLGACGLACAGDERPALQSNPAGAVLLTYPVKPITIVVAYAPGGQGDLLARIISQHLSVLYKQPIVIDNRPGVAGALGTRVAAKSKGDGYTLFLGQTGEMVLNRVLIKDLGYDPMKDLKPVVLVANAPLVLLTSAQSPFKSVADLVAAAKANPGGLSYGSVGSGTPGHLAAQGLTAGHKLDMVHVPYKGVGPLLTDLMSQRISMFFSSAGAAMPQLNGGKVRALAVTTPKRMKLLADVPTVAESGLAGFNFSLWGGVFAPADTPPDIIQSLNKAINTVLELPEVRARFEADNMNVPKNTPAEFQDFVRAESEKYERLVRESHITADF